MSGTPSHDQETKAQKASGQAELQAKEDAVTPRWQKLGVANRRVELRARGTAEPGTLSCVLGSDACVQA